MKRPPLRIVIDQSGQGLLLPEDMNDVQVDLAWAFLRQFRTGEPFNFRTELELLAFAEAERDYSRQRRY